MPLCCLALVLQIVASSTEPNGLHNEIKNSLSILLFKLKKETSFGSIFPTEFVSYW